MTGIATTQNFHIDLSDKLPTLGVLASLQNRKIESLVTEAVDAYLVTQTERLADEQHAIASLNHFQETGLHTTPDEMRVWAESLLSDEPSDVPKCHR